jgi:endoglucanase
VQCQPEDLKRHWRDYPGCYLSAFISPLSKATEQRLVSETEILAYENKIGRKLAMIMVFLAWGHPRAMQAFPRDWCQQVWRSGAVPHITWEPWDFNKFCEHYRNQKISSGEWDDYIRFWARDIKAFVQPIFLRWGHEMNSDWYPWGGKISEGGAKAYVRAFRHIVDIFRSEGTHNVIWVWSPDVALFASRKAPFYYEPYYPGDAYVDWIGFDGYNFAEDGAMKKPWIDFKALYGDIYERCQALNSRAPFMLGEFASGEKGGSKAQWIADAYGCLKTEFPRIRAATWFDQDKESHWTVDSSPESLQAFKAAIQDPYFLERVVLP